ncbi:MAG: XdhC/CoxI family protein [Thermoplasmata archaeon]|nr:XdhC/CoxI family protein [Thermoplasmata archaeon]
MNTDRKLAREAVRLMEMRQPFARATVVRAVGSVPGKVGASMIVRADGSAIGTVGGAALEERVKELAAQAMREHRGDLYHFDLAKWRTGGLPSLCGGSVDIAVEFVPASPNLLLWGGGHVAHALSQLLPGLEFDHSVADDRPDWVGGDRFPHADRREVASPGELWDRFDPASFTHLYLLGYDAMKDLEVLSVSLDRFPNYIGLISSASKRAHMFATLRERGYNASTIARIHAPVGVPIGAQSPAEIAVSIVAEVIQSTHPPARRTPERHRATVKEHVGPHTA